MKTLEVYSECPFCSEYVFLYECNIIYLLEVGISRIFVFIVCPSVIDHMEYCL